jgi:hypothetical protein
MNRKQQLIERRPEGDYAVRKPNSDRASVVKATQAEAIDWAASERATATLRGCSSNRTDFT